MERSQVVAKHPPPLSYGADIYVQSVSGVLQYTVVCLLIKNI